jgi:hypothetical protein
VHASRLPHTAHAYRQRRRIIACHRARVVVDPEKIDRLLEQPHVCRRKLRPRIAKDVAKLVGVRPEQRRIEVLTIHVGVGARRRREVTRVVRRRVFGLEVHHQPDLVLSFRPVCLDAECVSAQQVVRREGRFVEIPVARRKHAKQVAAIGHDPGLVERHPLRHAPIELPKHDARIFGEPFADVAVEPSAAIVQRGRQVPVVERHQGLNALLEEAVDEPVVEIEAACVDRPGALRQYPAPCNAEAISAEPELLHEADVVAPPPVVIAGDVTGVAVRNETGSVTEAMPDVRAGAIGERRAFDLVRGGRRAPQEAIGKAKVVSRSRAVHRREDAVWRK